MRYFIVTRPNSYTPDVQLLLRDSDKAIAVKEVLTSTTDPAWTSAEQSAACLRMGAERAKGKFRLIEEITLAVSTRVISRTAEPDGTPYDFNEIIVYAKAAVDSGGGWGGVSIVSSDRVEANSLCFADAFQTSLGIEFLCV